MTGKLCLTTRLRSMRIKLGMPTRREAADRIELLERQIAELTVEPHPPSRHCMCDDCKPSFQNDSLRYVSQPAPTPDELAEQFRRAIAGPQPANHQSCEVAQVGNSEALDVLKELVTCKDLKEAIYQVTTTQQQAELHDEYARRQPLAWAAARALVSVQLARSAQPVSEWQPISTLPFADDLIWLRIGDSIEGPRAMDPYDYDKFTEWAPCEPPVDETGNLHRNHG